VSATTLTLVGDKRLLRKFDRLDRSVQRRLAAKHLSRGASPILKALRAAAPRQSGATSKSIRMRRPKPKRKGTRLFVIGPVLKEFFFRRTKTGKRVGTSAKKAATLATAEKRNPGKYSHLVERGHGGPHPAPAHAWAGPTFKRVASGVHQRIAAGLARDIEAEARRA
jgi:HK97 gp10 family phage protein